MIEESSQSVVGRTLAGRYRVEAVLGQGATGVVVKAIDCELGDSAVALKLLSARAFADETRLKRFRKEVQLLRQLTHRNIIRIFDFVQEGSGPCFISMEYVEGRSLRQLLQEEGRLPIGRILGILCEIAEAMKTAHEAGIVHRDLKPDNVLLGTGGAVKVVDFGVARFVDGDDQQLTRTGDAVGTPYYMSPEQLAGSPVDSRADIYAFGILAYELAVGAPPFAGDTYYTIAEQHFSAGIPIDKLRAAGVPEWYVDFIEQCMQKNPRSRFQQVDEMLRIMRARLPREKRGSRPILLPGTAKLARRRIVRRMDRPLTAGIIGMLLIGAVTTSIACRYRAPNRVATRMVLELERRLGTRLQFTRDLLNVRLEATRKAFISAVDEGNADSTAILLDYGFNPNNVLVEGVPVISLAIQQGRSYTVGQLIDAGASMDFRYPDGMTPLMKAVHRRYRSTTKELLKRGAPLFDVDEKGRNVLEYLFSDDYSMEALPSLIKILIEHGYPPNMPEPSSGKTALNFAACGRHLSVVWYLLREHNADLTIPDKTGLTAAYCVDQLPDEEMLHRYIRGQRQRRGETRAATGEPGTKVNR